MNYEHRRHPYMTNEQLQPHISQINGYDNVKGPNVNFLGLQKMYWQEIREKAAEILAEKMWNNPGKF